MEDLSIIVSQKEITTVSYNKIIRGTIGAKVKVEYDDFWKDYNVRLVFRTPGSCHSILVYTNIDNVYEIPSEVVASSGTFKVGVVGTTDSIRLPTLWSEDYEVEYGTDTNGSEVTRKTPELINQLIDIAKDANNNSEQALETANEVKNKADNGDFDGATFIPDVDEAGNISWTNDKSLTNPDTQNIRGPQGIQGPKGDAGFSPTATVSKVNDTATITITDVNGTTTAQITDGVTQTIDQTYNPDSINGQSGIAVAQALQNEYTNTITTPATVADSNGGKLSNIDIIGKSIQDGTPTPTTPIAIQNVGNTLTLKSGVSADDTNATIYTIPLTDINGTSHIMRQFDEVKKHDDGKWYFDCNSAVKEFSGTETWNGNYSLTNAVDFYTALQKQYSAKLLNYSMGNKTTFTLNAWTNNNSNSYHSFSGNIYAHLHLPNSILGLTGTETNDEKKTAFTTYLSNQYSSGNSVIVEYLNATTTSYELSASTSAILDNIAIQKGNANIYFTNAVVPTMTADYPQDLQLYCNPLVADISTMKPKLLVNYTTTEALNTITVDNNLLIDNTDALRNYKHLRVLVEISCTAAATFSVLAQGYPTSANLDLNYGSAITAKDLERLKPWCFEIMIDDNIATYMGGARPINNMSADSTQGYVCRSVPPNPSYTIQGLNFLMIKNRASTDAVILAGTKIKIWGSNEW